ncbi:MAG: hypothetical protein KKC68_01055 [Candidatus Thermoplasmatota archaeon]|nr:hypothetical protein [Candidatus Thermoplasmatota archaeon]MBU1940338.1 hypothetical protein [Candidatus Thermoplasmatota archaeon]
MKSIIYNNFTGIATVLLAIILIGSSSLNVKATELSQPTNSFTTAILIPHYIYTSEPIEEQLTIPGYGYLLIPGKPALPSKIYTLALPPGATLSDLRYTYTEMIQLPGTYTIPPVSSPQVIGQENPVINERDRATYEQNYHEVYTSNDPYPSESVAFLRTAAYREYNLIDIRITPFTYYPLTQELFYYPEITITVEYQPSPTPVTSYVASESFPQKMAHNIITNINQVEEWYTTAKTRSTYDFVIITIDDLVDDITDLVQWEENKGHNVNVVTTSWIDSAYAGYDLQEKMRNFLREKYPTDEWGILDVLVIGDYDDVPMRRTAQNTGYGNPETDFYYAELTKPDSQSWDADGDHQYGENSDPIDFYGEVTVGRIPWSDPPTVHHICEKTVAYEQTNDPSFKKNILLLGAFFWPDTDNAVLMETKVNQPWMTDWTMTRMYEQGQSTFPMDYNLEYANVLNIWSQGSYAFVNWAGHGSPTGCYEYYPSQPFVDTQTCESLNDDYPAIIFADACSNSDTDYLNIGQAMLRKGGVGFLGATKVAYGKAAWNNPYSGSSQSLDYFFTVGVTSDDFTQGQSHQWSLVEMYTNSLWYYDKYETFEWGALWGNPDLRMGIINRAPDKPTTPQGPTQGINEISYSFTSSSEDPEGEDLFYQFDWNDGNQSSWIGPFSTGTPVEASYTWMHPGTYDVVVRAKDTIGTPSVWSDPLTITIIQGPIIDVGLISGGLFTVKSVIRNMGAAEALNVNWSISLEGGTILMGRETTGVISTISAGAAIEIASSPIIGFGKSRVIVEADIPRSSDMREQGATTLLFFIIINPGGG